MFNQEVFFFLSVLMIGFTVEFMVAKFTEVPKISRFKSCDSYTLSPCQALLVFKLHLTVKVI